MRETLRECREHARRLAVALHDKHYPEVTQWRPLDDLLGIIDQIDNMTTGLTAPLMSEENVEQLWTALAAHQSRDGTWLQVGKQDFRIALSTSPPQGGSN